MYNWLKLGEGLERDFLVAGYGSTEGAGENSQVKRSSLDGTLENNFEIVPKKQLDIKNAMMSKSFR